MSTSTFKSLASRRLKFQLVFVLIFVGAMGLLSWLILGQTSPFHNYFLYHVALPNVWVITLFIPYVLSAMIAGNPHSPSEIFIVFFAIIEWAIVGWVIAIPLSKLWTRLQNK